MSPGQMLPPAWLPNSLGTAGRRRRAKGREEDQLDGQGMEASGFSIA
jgi:hypothetical protein